MKLTISFRISSLLRIGFLRKCLRSTLEVDCDHDVRNLLFPRQTLTSQAPIRQVTNLGNNSPRSQRWLTHTLLRPGALVEIVSVRRLTRHMSVYTESDMYEACLAVRIDQFETQLMPQTKTVITILPAC
jgi:hypothetical protein